MKLRCPRCTGVMKLKSLLTNPKSLRRLLTTLGEPVEVQGKAPARAPPYFASKVVRRHFGQPDHLARDGAWPDWVGDWRQAGLDRPAVARCTLRSRGLGSATGYSGGGCVWRYNFEAQDGGALFAY